MSRAPVRPQSGDSRWEGVEEMRYKDEGSAPFRDITRQVLFQDPALACELRYFEMQPGGYSTLERHEHAHAVMIQRGRGRVLVGDARVRRRRARPRAHPGDDLAPVPRPRRRAVRLPVHGQRRARSAAAADGGRPRRVARRSGDRRVHPHLKHEAGPQPRLVHAAAGAGPRMLRRSTRRGSSGCRFSPARTRSRRRAAGSPWPGRASRCRRRRPTCRRARRPPTTPCRPACR